MDTRRILQLTFALGLLLLVAALWWPNGERTTGDPIRIAFAGPVSGPSAEDGLSAVRAIELVIERANAAGGVAGRPLALDIYDDANDVSRARENAPKIADQSETIAVIGHNFSTCSIAAGEIYAERGLPAISSAATSVDVTRDNPWYFRVVYNDRVQGQLVALYIAEVLESEHLGIIHETAKYGAYLADVMESAATEAGIRSVDRWGFDPDDPKLGDRLDAIVPAADRAEVDSLILAMQPAAGVALVKRLKDAGYPGRIVVTDALASQAFIDGFAVFPEEQIRRGHYTDGLYASTPLLFDAAGRLAGDFYRAYVARNDRAPDWYAAFAADAATVIIEALRRGDLSPSRETIDADRAALRAAVAAIDQYTPVDGVTGTSWFDEVGDALKPAPMGRFTAGEIVSAFSQLRLVEGLGLDGTSDPKRLVEFGGRQLYRTEVARVGVVARRFGALDFENGSFDLDFDVWFRHRGDSSVEDVVFTNAITPIALGKAIDEMIDGPLRYHLYRASGTFRADTLDTAYGEHSIAISLHHATRTRDDLIFAVDSIGMNIGRDQSRLDRSARARRLLGSASPWTVDDMLFFEESFDEHARGHPSFLKGGKALRRFSQLTLGLSIRPDSLSLARSMPERFRRSLVAAGLIGSILLLFVGRSAPKRRWILQAIFALLLLAAAEPLIGAWLKDLTGSYQQTRVSRAFAVLWWLVPAFLINIAIDRFIWGAVAAHSGHRAPSILRYFIGFLIYVFAIFGIIAFVYDYRLTGLLATSGVLAMILGLAVQINITNIFAGVAINLERPFRVGDWIMVHGRTPSFDDGVIGKVTDINWRTTRLETADDTEIVIPNGIISEKTITNFMSPGETSRFELFFTVDQAVPPERVIGIIQSAVDAVSGSENEGPLREPKPSVRIQRTSDQGIEYMIRYRLIPREVSPAKARHTINTAVLHALRAAGIPLAYPRRIYSGVDPLGMPAETNQGDGPTDEPV
ncbi:MAG: ABC transporter substrate-binding protein [Deltaproteobacteria bacterium]|nr:ABC transporter substrate-binding protein [Deltaproteobacteria bacterium]